MHRVTNGNPKYQAIVSFLYKKEVGATLNVFNKIDIMNLPNPA